MSSEVMIAENVLPCDECAQLTAIYNRYWAHARTAHPDWAPVVLDYYTLRELNPVAATHMYRTVLECRRKIESELRTPELFIEHMLLACLSPGESHIDHADNEKEENGQWVPNHTPQRDFTTLLYLNGDFIGGELVFRDRGLRITPKAGLLVGFPCTREFVHGVPAVQSGKRYSLPVWYTLDQTRAMRL